MSGLGIMDFRTYSYARPLDSKRWFLVGIFLFFSSIGFGQMANVPKRTAAKHRVHHRAIVRHHVVRRKIKKADAKKSVMIQNHIQRHMPPPGHDGEEHSDWFWRRRAWPNQTIDPAAYPTALAEARHMPVLQFGRGKDATLASFTWQPIGPNSIDGRISCIATHPTDSNTFYIGAAAGGLWKTTDHGSNWRCVTDTFGSLPTGFVAIDPVQPETLYLGLGEPNQSGDSYPGDGLWKSTDGGNSWQYLAFATSQYIGKIIIDPRNHDNIYVAIPGAISPVSDTNRGVYRSTNGGLTWAHPLLPRLTKSKNATPVGCIDIAMNPLNSSELLAYAWDHSLEIFAGNLGPTGPGSGVWRSSDSGNTWNRIDTVKASGLPNGYAEKILGRGALVWTASGTNSYAFAAIIRRDTNPVTHYPFDENFEGLYRSTDEGVTWSKVLDSTKKIPMGGVQGKDSANITNAQGGYDLYLAANPARPNEIYLGGIDIFRSTDFGLTFNDITNSYSQYYVKDNRQQHSDQHGLAFTAASSGTDMIVVSDGGVFHTNDFGTTWNQTVGLPITEFYSIEPWRAGMANTPATISATDLRLFGGTQDNGTVGHGLTPNAQTFGTDSDFAWINAGDGGVSISHPTDTNKLISSLQLGVIFARNTLDSLVPIPLGMKDTTHDTRPRWHTLSYRLAFGPKALTDTEESCGFVAPIALDDEHPTDLYTGRCHVYRATIDWTDLENTVWHRWSPTLAGVLTNDSQWYYGDVETIAIGPEDGAGHPMLWAGGYNGSNGTAAVWRTTLDPARQDTVAPNWISVNTGVPQADVSQIVPDRSDSLTAFLTTVFAGNIPRVLRTTDGGAHWTSISGNLPLTAPASALVIDTLAEQGNPLLKNQILIVGTDVGVFTTTNGGQQWEQLGAGMPHAIVSDLKIYKNMLIAATHGRSLYAMDISALVPGALGVKRAPESALSQVTAFPNPVQGGTEFEIALGLNSQPVTSCKLIEESSGEEFGAKLEHNGDGSYAISPPSSLSPGAYIVQLFAGNQLVGQGRVSIVR